VSHEEKQGNSLGESLLIGASSGDSINQLRT